MSQFDAGSVVGNLVLNTDSFTTPLQTAVEKAQSAAAELQEAIEKPFAPAAESAQQFAAEVNAALDEIEAGATTTASGAATAFEAAAGATGPFTAAVSAASAELANAVDSVGIYTTSVAAASEETANAVESLGVFTTSAAAASEELANASSSAGVYATSTASAAESAEQLRAELASLTAAASSAAAAMTEQAAATTAALNAETAAFEANASAAMANASAKEGAAVAEKGLGSSMKMMSFMRLAAFYMIAAQLGIEGTIDAFKILTGTEEDAIKANESWKQTLESLPVIGKAMAETFIPFGNFVASHLFGRRSEEEIKKDLEEGKKDVEEFAQLHSRLAGEVLKAHRDLAADQAGDKGLSIQAQIEYEHKDALAEIEKQKQALMKAQTALGLVGLNKGTNSDEYRQLAIQIAEQTKQLGDLQLTTEKDYQQKRLNAWQSYVTNLNHILAGQADALGRQQSDLQVETLRDGGDKLGAVLAQIEEDHKQKLQALDKEQDDAMKQLGSQATLADRQAIQAAFEQRMLTMDADAAAKSQAARQDDADRRAQIVKEANDRLLDLQESAQALSLRSQGKYLDADLAQLQSAYDKRMREIVDRLQKEEKATTDVGDAFQLRKNAMAEMALAKQQLDASQADARKSAADRLLTEQADLHAALLDEQGRHYDAELARFDAQWKEKIDHAKNAEEEMTLQATYESERRQKIREHESQESSAMLRQIGELTKQADGLSASDRKAFYADLSKLDFASSPSKPVADAADPYLSSGAVNSPAMAAATAAAKDTSISLKSILDSLGRIEKLFVHSDASLSSIDKSAADPPFTVVQF